MLALALILVVVIAGLIVWDLYLREQEPTRQLRGQQWPQRQRSTPPVARFKANGTVAPRAERPRRKRGPIGRAVAPGARFGGEVTRQPNAVGLACGRPISECKRGRNCLCV
jgi:hypothetical protein